MFVVRKVRSRKSQLWCRACEILADTYERPCDLLLLVEVGAQSTRCSWQTQVLTLQTNGRCGCALHRYCCVVMPSILSSVKYRCMVLHRNITLIYISRLAMISRRHILHHRALKLHSAIRKISIPRTNNKVNIYIQRLGCISSHPT